MDGYAKIKFPDVELAREFALLYLLGEQARALMESKREDQAAKRSSLLSARFRFVLGHTNGRVGY